MLQAGCSDPHVHQVTPKILQLFCLAYFFLRGAGVVFRGVGIKKLPSFQTNFFIQKSCFGRVPSPTNSP
jgi:hypothetical protein